MGKRRELNAEEKKNARIAYSIASFGIIGFLTQLIYFVVVYSIDDWLAILTYWIVFIMPGYIANAGMLIWGGGKPLDGGKIAKDGRRLFGPGKTIRGFVLGPFGFAIPIALLIHGIVFIFWGNIETAVANFLAAEDVTYVFYDNNPDQLYRDLKLYLLGDAEGTNDWITFLKLIPRVVLVSFGAALGDLVGSWFKRRKNVERGEPLWIIDQLDFLGGCLLLGFPFLIIGGFDFSTINLNVFIMLFIITPSITVIANTISYLLGKKKHPW